MSDSGSDLPPVNVIQGNFDSFLGAVILQAFVNGIYTLLFFRTIRAAVPSLRKDNKIFLVLLLLILYCLTMINFALGWVVARSFFIVHNETREAMADQFFNHTLTLSQAGNGCGQVAIFIADTLLVWRCYVVWNKNKLLLCFFTLLQLGEFVLIPMMLVLHTKLGPAHVPIVSLYLFISMGITVVVTGMIIYRILTVSRFNPSGYGYIVEILLESGILYSATLFISGIMTVIPNESLGIFETSEYFTAILIPITGIAPTLISARILGRREQDDERWSQPASIIFKFSKQNTRSTTLNSNSNSELTTKPTSMSSSGAEKGFLGKDLPELTRTVPVWIHRSNTDLESTARLSQ